MSCWNRGEMEVYLHLFLISALDGAGYPKAMTRPLYLWKITPLLTLEEAVWGLGPVRRTENLLYPPGFEVGTVVPIASRYILYASLEPMKGATFLQSSVLCPLFSAWHNS
jgi:hypothetical protein